MKWFAGSLAFVCVLTGIAKAESFAFVARTDVVNRVVAPVAGSKTIVAQFSKGGIDATYPSKKVRSEAECATWPAPPGGMFTTSGACVATEDDGSAFTVVVSCRFIDERSTISDCFGTLTGVAGAYQDKTGTVTWRSTATPDGRSSRAEGTGIWN